MNHLFASVLRWFDDEAGLDQLSERYPDRLDLLRIIPFLILHIACLGIIWTGWSTVAVGTAIGLYVVRMLGITGTYHRYFSYRTYKMSRFWQFVFTIIANSSAQRGALWWASQGRNCPLIKPIEGFFLEIIDKMARNETRPIDITKIKKSIFFILLQRGFYHL